MQQGFYDCRKAPDLWQWVISCLSWNFRPHNRGLCPFVHQEIHGDLHCVGPKEVANVCSGTGWKMAERGKSHPLGSTLGKFFVIDIVRA